MFKDVEAFLTATSAPMSDKQKELVRRCSRLSPEQTAEVFGALLRFMLEPDADEFWETLEQCFTVCDIGTPVNIH